VVVDTDSIGFTAVTGGSRTTFATGWAAYEAAQDVLRQMKERAAKIVDLDLRHSYLSQVEIHRQIVEAMNGYRETSGK